MSNEARTFSVSHVPNQTFPGVTVSGPSNIDGFDVVQFGLATERPWETLSAYEVDIFLDTDESVTFGTSGGPGQMIWLFQNNPAEHQVDKLSVGETGS